MNEHLGRTPGCIPYERFGEELTAAERDHLAGCGRCEAELALARSFEADEADDADGEAVASIVARLQKPRAENVVSLSRRRSAGARPLLAIAATIAVVLGGTFFVRQRERTTFGDGSGIESSYRSLRVRVLAPAGDVAAPPAELRWAAVPGAAAYDVAVLEVDGTPLWRTTTRSPRVELPHPVAASFAPQKTVVWQVTARRGAEVLAESGAVKFRVVPPQEIR